MLNTVRPQGGVDGWGNNEKEGKEEGNHKEEWKKGDKWNKML